MTVISSTDLFHAGSKPTLRIRELLCFNYLPPSHLCQWYLDINFQVWTSQSNSCIAGTVQRDLWSICGQWVNNHCWNWNIECSKLHCYPCLKTAHKLTVNFQRLCQAEVLGFALPQLKQQIFKVLLVKALVTTASSHRNCNCMEAKKEKRKEVKHHKGSSVW